MPLDGKENSPEKTGDRTFTYASGGAEASNIGDALFEIFKELAKINQCIDSVEISNRESSSPSRSRPQKLSPPSPRGQIENLVILRTNSQVPSVQTLLKRKIPMWMFFKNIQQDFNSLKSSVEKVILPSHLKLQDSRSGIKREDQPVLTVLSKCVRYIETSLKVLGQIREDDDNVDLNPFATILLANLKFLQDEYAALLVNGKFDKNTSQLFCALQTHNSGFNSECLQNVRVAAELSSISNWFTQPPTPSRGRGRWRGKDFNRDIFQQLRGPP